MKSVLMKHGKLVIYVLIEKYDKQFHPDQPPAPAANGVAASPSNPGDGRLANVGRAMSGIAG